MPADYVETAIRLAAAAVLGCLLGLTRDMADKPAGMRTMGLVGITAKSPWPGPRAGRRRRRLLADEAARER